MNRNWFKPAGVLALAFSLVLASCDSLSDNSPLAPSTPTPAASSSMKSVNAQASIIAADGHNYHIVQSSSDDGLLGISNVLGLLGGTLNVGGHKLVVPQGAVLSPTLFTVLVPPTGNIEVHLSALQINLLGIIDIGGKGFAKPVALSLSYRDAIGVTDPSHLHIAELKSDGTLGVVLPVTIDTAKKTVTGQLPHFSSWVLICD